MYTSKFVNFSEGYAKTTTFKTSLLIMKLNVEYDFYYISCNYVMFDRLLFAVGTVAVILLSSTAHIGVYISHTVPHIISFICNCLFLKGRCRALCRTKLLPVTHVLVDTQL